jgi:superfamily II DNA or RNA helicase
VTTTRSGFIDERRLLHGPWQALERDVARLLLMNGFEDVRLVGGRGDQGADILGVRGNRLWIVQCKHTSSSHAPREAIAEAVNAARYYEADEIAVATSRPPGTGFQQEKDRYERAGLRIRCMHPRELLDLIAGTPEYAPSRKRLRDYQEEASTRLREALLDTGRGQIVLATGLGKTVVMAETVADLLRDGLVPDGRVLILAHTRDLIDQLHRGFWPQLPKWVHTHQLIGGEMPSFWEGITFATVQSVASRVETLPPFGLVLVDEAHHIGAESFRRVVSTLSPRMLGGVTATPWRGDGYDIDELLGPPVSKVGIAEGLQRGFLTEVDYRLLADNLDWEVVQDLSRHRYSIQQLNRRLIVPTRDEQAARIVADVFRRDSRRGGIVYSPTIIHAEHFAAILRTYGLRVEAVSADSEPRDRDRLMSAFRAGQLDLVTTVDLFNEGVDVPDVDLIVFMRSTHSRRIFVQQLGRGLRLSPNKDRVIVLDFVTDLRRMSEVLELDSAVRGGSIERLGLGSRIVEFTDRSAGGFLREWILDQASLFSREDDATLELPRFDFPTPAPPGGVE